jgi:spore protease
MNGNLYTDMAVEVFEKGLPRRIEKKEIGAGVLKSVVEVKDEAEEAALGKRRGVYITLDTKSPYFRSAATERVLVAGLATALKKLSEPLFSHGSVLVVGLGNEGMTADSLGPLTVSKLSAAVNGGNTLKTLTPGVRGVTGVESFDVITGVCAKIKPDLVILVDTLASSKAQRLYSSFQLSTAGIVPGGGVGNRKPALNRDSLGIPVIVAGVPLVLYARTLVSDCFQAYAERVGGGIDENQVGLAVADSLFGDYNLVVTPKEIDIIADGCAEILSRAIAKAFS